MPHNPRRDRDRSRPEAELTDDLIRNAIGRAVSLRQATALCPNAVTGQSMTAADARDATRRLHRPSWELGQLRKASPWWWIGWVHYSLVDDTQAWEVWLHEDGRVWLRYRRPPD